MIEIEEILNNYDKDKIAIGTIGSHSALNIFKGAKDEGLRTVCICRKGDEIVYRRFPVTDEILLVEDFRELLDDRIQEKLRRLNTILIPHGSFNAYLDLDEVMDNLCVPMFGNRQLLQWEVDREKQEIWLRRAGLQLPKTFDEPDNIEGLTIVKFPGAKGGKGYFLVDSPEAFHQKSKDMIQKGFIKKEDVDNIHLQEYIFGVTVYPSYFRSLLRKRVELLCVDRRYESSIDSLGRIPAEEQLKMDSLAPTYTVIGNFPITLRESLLSRYIRMGDNVVKVSEEIAPPGIIGPFCLETIVNDVPEVFTFEISARIVAGTNVGVGTSPYSYLMYGERIYMGRRIAMEVKSAIAEGKIGEVVT
ncbi:MAG: formate--phosphoribosylaminoimidazolecarboxamide ligase [Candidatus Bathyarchaeota archaeon]|nr:formate--phosphoribosylaminoimidazolecarboxamide ligase [Candidatus Bathyarchaeota archaeon]